ncbi:MAG TPA: hypothetical protein VF258_05745, partial [Luteolibacter sp.]
MTTDPPSSAEGSALPPRHRPNMGDLAKDTTELNLWAFDDSEPISEESPPVRPKTAEFSLPPPRNIEKMKRMQPRDDAAPTAGAAKEQIKLNIGKPNPRPLHTGFPAIPPKPGSDFDELEQWEEREQEPLPSITFQKIESREAAPAPEPLPVTAPEPITSPVDDENEFSSISREDSAPVPLRLQWSLSKIERLGLIALIGVLVIGGIAVFVATIGRLPTESMRMKSNDFPIKGKYLSIQSADSHWRAPGEGDAVRRGTQLLPVVNLVASGGPAAVRIFFRNSDGELVGDPVTRSIQSGGKFQVAATAGFDDVGMHAAYHTGQSKPWTIEVLEAPLEDTQASAFVTLFEMDISTERR